MNERYDCTQIELKRRQHSGGVTVILKRYGGTVYYEICSSLDSALEWIKENVTIELK